MASKKVKKEGKTKDNVIDLGYILSDLDIYEKEKKRLLDIIRSDLNNRFNLIDVQTPWGVETFKITNLITNLIAYRPFVEFGQKLPSERFVLECKNISTEKIEDYMDELIPMFFSDFDFNDLSESIASIIEEMDSISIEFNIYFGNTINLRNIVESMDESDEVDRIIHKNIDESMTFEDMEKSNNKDTNELIKILTSEKSKSCFKPYLLCGEGINKGQFTQMFVNIGPRPDLEGNVYPEIINTNFIMGLLNAANYYLDSSGGRKASITNNTQVKKAGYTMRKLSFLCMDTFLSRTTTDCGSRRAIKFFVKDKKTLERISLRYYHPNMLSNEKILIRETDEHLIGKTIFLRSPVTCTCKDGICKTCYGTLPNDDIHIGTLAILILTSQLTQRLLSSKHLLKTISEKIDFDKKFLKYFYLDGNSIMPQESMNFKIVINRDDINDEDEDGKKSINTFKIVDKEGEKQITVEKDLIISEDISYIFESYKQVYEIDTKNLDETAVFYIIIENNELSKSLHQILNLIDNKKAIESDIDMMVSKFNDLLNDSGITINLVHIECIIRELTRDVVNVTRRPDFTDPNVPYTILRMTEANMKSPSIFKSFSFEQIKKQIYDPSSYLKDGASSLDLLV